MQIGSFQVEWDSSHLLPAYVVTNRTWSERSSDFCTLKPTACSHGRLNGTD